MGFFDGLNNVFGNLAPLNNAGGLLDPTQAFDAQRQGLLGLGTGLLAAGGPSPYPISFGQAAAGAALQSNAMQNNAIDSALKRQLVAEEIRKNAAALQALQNRPNIGALFQGLAVADAGQRPAITPQQAQLLGVMAQVDPGAAFAAAGRIPGLLGPAKPEIGELGKKVADFKAAMGRDPTQAEIQKMAGVAQAPDVGELGKKIADFKAAVGRDPTQEEIQALAGIKQPENPGDKVLPPAELNSLTVGGQQLPYGTTSAQAAAAGAMPTTADQLKQRAAIASAQNTVADLKNMAFGEDGKSGVFTGGGGTPYLTDSVPARGLLGISHGIGWAAGSPESKARSVYTNTAQGVMAPIIRALGDSGALSDPDVKRAQDLVPQLGALPVTEEEAKAQFAELEQLITKGVANYQSRTGGGSSGGVPEYDFVNGKLVPRR